LPSARFANNLRHIFELVDDRFEDGALAGQQLVIQAHQVVLPMAARLSKKLDAPVLAQLSRS